MNPIEKALAQADRIQAACRELEEASAQSHSLLWKKSAQENLDRMLSEARSYVVGLPVVITVHPDGSVTVDVDMSEASDIAEGAGEGQPTDDETLDKDASAIDKAVAMGTYTVDQPTPV